MSYKPTEGGTQSSEYGGPLPFALSPDRQSYLVSALVPELVAARSAERPNDTAVVVDNKILTYEELNRRANQISRVLRSWGVGPDTLVGLCVERSAEQVIAGLGILQSGGAYVPMDPAYPQERLAYMLNDAQPAVLVTTQRVSRRLPAGRWRTLTLDVNLPQVAHHSTSAAECCSRPENLAYVIYTSGSTGRPKGVQITHKNLLNLVFWHQREFNVNSQDRASQLASPGFDAAVWELWPYLTAGASVHVVDDAVRSQPAALRDWLVRHGITIGFVPTPLAERMIALEWPTETALRVLLTGADTLHGYPPPKLPFVLVNNYGPTECTVVATSCPVAAKEDPAVQAQLPPIGWPISNVEIFILDQHLTPVPVGTTGEIYIAGAGLGLGYLNCPELTAAKFVINPFAPKGNDRLYRTGDLGRYLPDGRICFQGRIDDQIKIRGYRIEPNEIVASLNEHPSILASAVVAREQLGGDKYLVAYLVLDPDTKLAAPTLRDFLYARLPEHLVPRVFVELEALPLSANGKIDTASLPAPDEKNTLTNQIVDAPHNMVEVRLVQILVKLLNVGEVDINDNFFLLGGHSLLAAQLLASVRDVFGVELPLRAIFDSPTAAGLSLQIEHALMAHVESMTSEEVARALADSQAQG
jgi:amino acid adenylation domain-containing protein